MEKMQAASLADLVKMAVVANLHSEQNSEQG
jgi:hypothetical protein